MFDSLSEKLDGVFKRLAGRGRLTEKEVDEALREVRLALLEADVNFKVVRDFVARIRERSVGEDVLGSLTPGQQVIKIVHEELLTVLGEGNPCINLASTAPTIIMMVGLQGSGKTTTCAKLALMLRKQGQRPLLVAADVYRPAAIDQLVTLGKQLDIPVHEQGANAAPLDIVTAGVAKARELGSTVVILDTAGRLHVDDGMMNEVAIIKERLQPHEVLLVVDAMTGQDAVRAAGEFHARLGVTGLILSKTDGDARGGAALSVRAVTGVPVRFMGTGEKPDAFEPFHPDRLAQRILGMGDVLTLIEKAQANIDQQKAEQWEKKLRTASFTLEDFLDQLQQVKKMGPLSQLLEMIPGMSSMAKKLPAAALDDRQLKKVEAIIYSMTPRERRRPDILDGSRRRRIAKGSGTTPADVNQLLNQFTQMQKMLKQYGNMFSGKAGARRMPQGPFKF
ncbi:MAG: signal recognition particle protein [Dehalococcoidia bacterium]|nr:signal recognition particle protein [Dehalococcoidia bacterium]